MMKMLNRSKRVITSTSALGLILAGCAISQSVTIEPVLESPPLVEPLPVTVGVFYSKDFRTAAVWQREDPECDVNPLCTPTFAKSNYQLGEPSTELFNNVFTGLFQTTVEIPSWPEASGLAPDISGVIAPRIKSFSVRPPPQNVQTGQYKAQITYEFNLYKPDGTLLGSWEASGLAEANGGYGWEWIYSFRGEVTAKAMRDAAADFTLTFHSQPPVVRWLESLKTGS